MISFDVRQSEYIFAKINVSILLSSSKFLNKNTFFHNNFQ